MSRLFRLFLIIEILLANTRVLAQPPEQAFTWPEGKSWALSFSFDDARPGQVETAIPLLNRENITATFYVMPAPVSNNLASWKKALEFGHEIGNHTIHHPCSINSDWVTEDTAIENYTLERMRDELGEANRRIEELLGVAPTSFAYTCGATSVGKGEQNRSYRPLVAELFASGRGWQTEAANDPRKVDLAHVLGMNMDNTSFETLKPVLDAAREKGFWVVLVGHEVVVPGQDKPDATEYATHLDLLESLIRYARAEQSQAWIAPVGTVAGYIERQRD
jgi:peptidoglycan/xylan/chitin deacetylase (PgdA/CDA1 family)